MSAANKESPVLVVNLWMLKSANGMWWYAIEYLKKMTVPLLVVVRSQAIAAIARDAFPAAEVRQVGLGELTRLLFLHVSKGHCIYTPTPHPVPFARRQWILFHDAYPFIGRLGWLKRAMLVLGVKTSGCTVAYINKSAGLRYLVEELGIDEARTILAPNILPPGPADGHADDQGVGVWPAQGRSASREIVVGLFGTDSPKKRYDDLFDAAAGLGAIDRLRFMVYGSATRYIAEVAARHPGISLVVVEAAVTPMAQFLAQVDCVASIARGEGFGRPIAAAIQHRVPTHLIDDPVFREFFDGLAMIYNADEALLQGILAGRAIEGSGALRSGFMAPAYRQAIDTALARLKQLALGH